MSGNLITNTALASMHALAFQGIMVTDCYPQLRDIIRHRLGEEYALLFAEPAPNPSSQSIDWYTPVQGTARPLLDLPVEEQNPLRERLAGMAQEVQRLADELKQAPDHIKRTQGNILELGLLYPGDQCLFVVFVAHFTRLLFVFELLDILISKRQFGPEQYNLPTALHPNQSIFFHGINTAYH